MSRRLVRASVALLACSLFLYGWWVLSISQYRYPAQPAFGKDEEGTSSSSSPLSGWKSHPGSIPDSRAPSADFLDLSIQHDLSVGQYDPQETFKAWTWAGFRHGVPPPRPCAGPRSSIVNGNAQDLPQMHLTSKSALNPLPLVGTFKQLGLDDRICYDRLGRLKPYGYQEEVKEIGKSRPQKGHEEINLNTTDWGDLQQVCLIENENRFAASDRNHTVLPFRMPGSGGGFKLHHHDTKSSESSDNEEPHILRKAVVIRAREGIKYTSEVLQHIRSMIMELSLHTGGEYTVYLLIEVTRDERAIEESSTKYQEALREIAPQEFHNITILYNEVMMKKWYYNANYFRGDAESPPTQPLQLLSLQNRQFSHIWDVPLETRYTGNWFHLLSSAMLWARQQPRKLQWERAAKYYIPSLHGTYHNFSDLVTRENPSGGIWGPVSSRGIQRPEGPMPPYPVASSDEFEWGVGEDADDIVPHALVDTSGMSIFAESHKGFDENMPGRALMAAPIKCLSRKLLSLMHDAQVDSQDMRPEVFAHTVALGHGLKVAALPLPLFFNDNTSPEVVDEMLNGAKKTHFFQDKNTLTDTETYQQTLAIKGTMSVWSRLGFDAFPQHLYRKWYGVNSAGSRPNDDTTGRLCLPEMLIYPVSDVVEE